MVRRDHLVEAKLIKELPLISVLPPHHRRLSCRQLSRNHCSLGSSSPFFDSIGKPWYWARRQATAVHRPNRQGTVSATQDIVRHCRILWPEQIARHPVIVCTNP